MFPARFFNPRFFAARFFAKFGATITLTPSGLNVYRVPVDDRTLEIAEEDRTLFVLEP